MPNLKSVEQAVQKAMAEIQKLDGNMEQVWQEFDTVRNPYADNSHLNEIDKSTGNIIKLLSGIQKELEKA